MNYTLYKHTCMESNKSYIGMTQSTMDERWKSHVSEALTQKKNYKFHNALRKYGIECWDHEVITETDDMKLAMQLEKDLIWRFGTVQDGYNICAGGQGRWGVPHTEESKQKIRDWMVGRKHTKEHNEKIRQKLIGRPVSKSQRAKVGESNSKNWEITHPNGKIETIRNLHEFCRTHGIDQGNMVRVCNGTKGYKQHKGFTGKRLV